MLGPVLLPVFDGTFDAGFVFCTSLHPLASAELQFEKYGCAISCDGVRFMVDDDGPEGTLLGVEAESLQGFQLGLPAGYHFSSVGLSRERGCIIHIEREGALLLLPPGETWSGSLGVSSKLVKRPRDTVLVEISAGADIC